MHGCNTACPPGYDFAVHRWDYQGKPVMHGGTPEKPPMVFVMSRRIGKRRVDDWITRTFSSQDSDSGHG
ncbi:hypothetical protein M0802_009741 [Mischocyttarus mexicanus]|nr:hypothetical protein M0802_009741 [Mischocyttarus mexicanus]